MSDDDVKGKVIHLMRSAKPRVGRRRQQPLGGVVSVNASGQAQIAGRDITNVRTEKYTTRVHAEPKPGAEHIIESQVRRLHDLKDEILRLEALAKRDPATAARVWGSLNKKMRVGAMRMIPASKFQDAERYLLT